MRLLMNRFNATQLWLAGGFKQTLAFAWYGNSGSSPWTIIVEVSTIKEMMYNLMQKTWAYSIFRFQNTSNYVKPYRTIDPAKNL